MFTKREKKIVFLGITAVAVFRYGNHIISCVLLYIHFNVPWVSHSYETFSQIKSQKMREWKWDEEKPKWMRKKKLNKYWGEYDDDDNDDDEKLMLILWYRCRYSYTN